MILNRVRKMKLNTENQILKEVQDIFGGAYPQMMAECINKSPTLHAIVNGYDAPEFTKNGRYFFYQEVIKAEDVLMITHGNTSHCARLLGVERTTLRSYIKNQPDKLIHVYRDANGKVNRLEK